VHTQHQYREFGVKFLDIYRGGHGLRIIQKGLKKGKKAIQILLNPIKEKKNDLRISAGVAGFLRTFARWFENKNRAGNLCFIFGCIYFTHIKVKLTGAL
ncbi:MAG: hypothetical protein WED82_02160, partial [Balneolales bacterium]